MSETTYETRAVGAVGIVTITGEVTSGSEEILMAAYDALDGVRAVVLDFADLEYMNSGGIGLLVTLLVRAQRHGQALLACGLSDHYRQIFELTRLDEAFGVHDDLETALVAAGRA